MKRITVILLALCLACTQAPKGPSTRSFPEVRYPAMLEGYEAMEYMAVHFWDAFLDTSGRWLCDSLHIAGVESVKVEEKVGFYTTVLGQISLQEARKGVAAVFDKMEACQAADTLSNVFEKLTELFSRYLYDPNSPVRNEDIYEPFVSRLSTSRFLRPSRKAGYAHDAQMCRLNAVGTPATDFTFTDIRGRRHTLYGVKAPYTLLFFTNPGCPSCREIIDTLVEEPLATLVNEGIIAVVNVYIDEDLDAWRDYEHVYPRTWYTGYDQDYVIRTDVLYNVRAIPSLYLLDSEKRVLLKDAPTERLLNYLQNSGL